MTENKVSEDDKESLQTAPDDLERGEGAGSPKKSDAALEPSSDGGGSTRNQPMEEGEVAGRTSAEAERIATGKQIEEEEHDVPKEAGDATTLLPSPMHLDLPPIDASDLGHGPDSPTTSLIQSLRDQLTQLHDQSQLLNTKLVTSISRHADLEDQHVHLQHQHKELQERSEILEQEKTRWEESMNTGLLVERAQIKDEMQKLAAGLVEEERRRGSAEERRIKVENEVDDLAASLFDQANTMVAVERIHRTNAETRLKETEENLAAAESAMRDMQLHLQSLPSSANPQVLSPPPSTISRRLLGSHVPYSEFLTFLSHLRALRPLRETSKTMFPPPIITNLVAQPFIARAITEDQDPALRLDAAPTISYFSRRTVTNAAIAGDLVIEPVPVGTLLTGTTSIHDLSCSLCGQAIFSTSTPGQPQSPSGSQFGPPPAHPTHRSSSRFSLKPFFSTPSPSATPADAPESPFPGSSMTVHVFRIAKPVQPTTGTEEKAKIYPLCKNGWCLQRLRATCELWYFVRMGIIHAVWHGDDGYVLSAERPAPVERTSSPVLEAPEQQVERKKSSWGLGFKLSEKSSWRTPFKAAESGPSSPGPQENEAGLEEAKQEAVTADDDTAERPQVDTEKLDLPSITKQEPSPVKKRDSGDAPAPALDRKDSNLSATSRESDDGFHTPANDEEDEEATPETPKAAEDREPVQTKSPRRSGSVSPRPRGPRERPGSSSGDKRNSLSAETGATLSPRASRDLEEDRSEVVEEAVEDDEADEDKKDTAEGDEGDAPEGDTEDAAQVAGTEMTKEDHSEEKQVVDLTTDAKPDSPTPPRLPPRLPPRKPQRASADSETLVTNAKWLDPNSGSWEVKTWKMVVKLKEEMWKARVGVEQV